MERVKLVVEGDNVNEGCHISDEVWSDDADGRNSEGNDMGGNDNGDRSRRQSS